MRFIGDVHGKFKQYKKIIEKCSESIQVGDLGVGFAKQFGDEYLASENPPFNSMAKGNHRFIRGNHDNPAVCSNHKFWIKDGHVENGMMFIGGADSIDKQRRIEGLSWWRNEQLSNQEWNTVYDIYASERPKVMITHDCPKLLYNDLHSHHVFENRDDVTAFSLDFFFREHKPKLWIFGHHHKSFEKEIDGTRFICLAELEYKDIEI